MNPEEEKKQDIPPTEEKEEEEKKEEEKHGEHCPECERRFAEHDARLSAIESRVHEHAPVIPDSEQKEEEKPKSEHWYFRKVGN